MPRGGFFIFEKINYKKLCDKSKTIYLWRIIHTNHTTIHAMSNKKDLLAFRGDTLHSAKRNRGKDTMRCSVTIDYYGKVVTYTVELTGYNHFDLRYRGDLQLIAMFCREHIVREFLTPGRK